MGGERARNADGSIPAWTGGQLAPPLPPGTSVGVRLFEDEKPLYTVTASYAGIRDYKNEVPQAPAVFEPQEMAANASF